MEYRTRLGFVALHGIFGRCRVDLTHELGLGGIALDDFTSRCRRAPYRGKRVEIKPPSGPWPRSVDAAPARSTFGGVQEAKSEVLPSKTGHLSWQWRKRSSVKITERTHEEATAAVHGGRKGRHSEEADDCEHESLVQVDVSPALNFSTTVDLFGIISGSAGSGEGIHPFHPPHSKRDGLRSPFAV